ncbi:hypothetical protein [Fusobacterium phage Fnu1]|uniref:Uncharacterized protein n=1 Tax=Fusobacterium phage Fnu1 TaxID=2530024 RepID=A0A481W5K8_9CAUD|nr:hypothetical protein KMD24_gp166 [Fusobacterium phage Fnu1]QBJ04149.1 hypothetical protein [Fusobacterium phage Fnu1]
MENKNLKLLQDKSIEFFNKFGVEALHIYYTRILETFLKDAGANWNPPIKWDNLPEKYKSDSLTEEYLFIKYIVEQRKDNYDIYRDSYDDIDVFLADPVLKMLLDYKAKYFIDEIFAELGLEIVGKRKEGGVLVSEIDKNKFIN